MRVLSGGRAFSRGSQRTRRFSWELDRDEMIGRIEVVIARLIHNADEAVLRAASVR